jgi:hypothetical protein
MNFAKKTDFLYKGRYSSLSHKHSKIYHSICAIKENSVSISTFQNWYSSRLKLRFEERQSSQKDGPKHDA